MDRFDERKQNEPKYDDPWQNEVPDEDQDENEVDPQKDQHELEDLWANYFTSEL